METNSEVLRTVEIAAHHLGTVRIRVLFYPDCGVFVVLCSDSFGITSSRVLNNPKPPDLGELAAIRERHVHVSQARTWRN